MSGGDKHGRDYSNRTYVNRRWRDFFNQRRLKKIKKSIDKSINIIYNILNKLRKRGKF